MKKKIFWIVLVAIISFWIYWFAFRMTKEKAIKIILKNSDASEDKLQNFGEDYLIARARAFQLKKDTFELNGKLYVTKTGLSVKS